MRLRVPHAGPHGGGRRAPACPRPRTGWLASAVLPGALLLAGLAACGPAPVDATDVGVRLEFLPEARTGPVTCELYLENADGTPLSGATIELEGNMNHAGMVPVFAEPEEVEPGHLRTDWTFTMGGDWFVVVRGELPDGRTLERIVDVPKVQVARPSEDDTTQGD